MLSRYVPRGLKFHTQFYLFIRMLLVPIGKSLSIRLTRVVRSVNSFSLANSNQIVISELSRSADMILYFVH